MDDDLDLRNFSNVTRLFPLPRVVMFPHAVLPLHVFEPRYQELTRDALADDKLITIVQLRLPASTPIGGLGSPPIEAVGCLGRIIQHDLLPDGRVNFLLLGRKRVRLAREIQSDKLYRSCEVEILEDEEDELDETHRVELIRLFRKVIERDQKVDPDMASILESALPLGVLTDIVAQALGLHAKVKQLLLADPRINERAECLLSILRQMQHSKGESQLDARLFPPPFSVN